MVRAITLGLSDYAPPVVNDPIATARLRIAVEAILGPQAVAEGPMMMVAEDMAEYLNRVPGSFFVLGAMPDGVNWAEPHHRPRFDIDHHVAPWRGDPGGGGGWVSRTGKQVDKDRSRQGRKAFDAEYACQFLGHLPEHCAILEQVLACMKNLA